MQENNSRKRVIVISLAGLAAFMALVMMMLTFAQVPVVYAAPNALVEQCANGDQGQFRDCRETGNHGWKNSQVNTNNGHYAEGDYMPYRQTLDGLVDGYEYCFGFGWDITQGNRPAVDYIATFTEDLDLADPTFQTIFSGSVGSPDLRVPIPNDPVIANGYWIDPANVFTGTLPATREIVVWGASSFTFGDYGWVNVINDPMRVPDISLADNEANSIEYCFTAAAEEVVLAWSGHIAVPEEWGGQDRPNGSPYHMSNGTRQDLFTGDRTSETDLSCNDLQDPATITHQNIGRNETQLQVGEVPTAIELRGINVGQDGINTTPWVAAFLGFLLMTGFFILRRHRSTVPIDRK